MRLLIAVLFLLSAFDSLAQTPRQVSHKGKTVYVYPYPVAEDQQRITPYLKPLPDGPYIAYYDKYIFYRFSIWKMGKKKHYTDSTIVAVEFNLRKGKKEGECVYYQKNGSLSEKGFYLNDEKEGEWTLYYPNKKKEKTQRVRTKTNYKKGKKNGTLTEYHIKGYIHLIKNYKNDVLNGPFTRYLPNGKIVEIKNFCDTSYSAFYDVNHSGYLDKMFFLKYGERFSRGIVSQENRLHGENTLYHPNGIKKFSLVFYYGKLMQLDTVYDYYGHPELILQKTDPSVPDTAALFNLFIYKTDEKSRVNYLKGKYQFRGTDLIEATVLDINKDTAQYYQNPFAGDQSGELTLIAKSNHYGRTDLLYLYRPGNVLLVKKYNYGQLINDFRILAANKKDSLLQIEQINYQYQGKLKTSKIVYFKFKQEVELQARIAGKLRNWNSINPGTGSDLNSLYEKYPDSTANEAERFYLNGKEIEGHVQFITCKKMKMDGQIKIKNNLTVFYDYTEYRNPGVLSGYFKKGLKDSVWQLNEGRLPMARYQYKDGLENGAQIEFEMKKLSKPERDYARECGVQLYKKQAYYMKSLFELTKGKADGEQVEFYYDGNIIRYAQYKNGIKHGVYESYNENGTPVSILTYRYGKAHGDVLVMEYSDNQFKNMVKTKFADGIPDGKYEHHSDRGIEAEGQFKKGYLSDEWYFYGKGISDKNVIRSVYSFSANDSVYAGREMKKMLDHQYFNPPPYLLPYNGIQYYLCPSNINLLYPNGKKAVVGRREKTGAVGLWKIFDENETVILSLDYDVKEKTFFPYDADSAESITAFAYAEQYYSTGQKRCEAWVYDESFNYDCIARLEIPEPLMLVKNYWSPDGKQSIKDGNGSAVFYDAAGRIKAEGELKNSFEEGLWKYYNTEGQLNAIGEMEKGKRTGKWFMGDLSGLHFDDLTCFDMNDPEMFNRIEYNKKIIEIREIQYEKGEVVSVKNYKLNLNEKQIRN